MENNEKLELRMYSLVLYQLTGIQAGIQSGHSNDEYANKYNDPENYLDWRRNWKTVIVLNGGSSVTLKSAIEDLKINGIDHCPFNEPDLDDIVTSVSFLVDERVFNRELYPDFNREYFISLYSSISIEEDRIIELLEEDYDKWVESIGGKKNEFLRTWLRKFRLAGT